VLVAECGAVTVTSALRICVSVGACGVDKSEAGREQGGIASSHPAYDSSSFSHAGFMDLQ
jgi:hypothetical protein